MTKLKKQRKGNPNYRRITNIDKLALKVQELFDKAKETGLKRWRRQYRMAKYVYQLRAS